MSYFLESLNTYIDGYYKNISVSDASKLSDVVDNSNIEDLVYSGGLVRLKILKDFKDLSFPCSYRFLRSLWEGEFRDEGFDRVISSFISKELLSVKKVTGNIFFNEDTGILRSNLDLKEDEEFLVFYSSSKFKELLEALKSFFIKKNRYQVLEAFGWSHMGKSFSQFFNRLRSDMRVYRSRVTVNLESFVDDKVSKKVEIALIIEDSQLSDIGERRVKEVMAKIINFDHVKEVEVYKDKSTCIYLGLILSRNMTSGNLSDLSSLVVYYYSQLFSKE